MTAPLTSTDPVSDRVVPTAAHHLTVALGKIDRLLRVETNRSKHMVLVQIRTELFDGIAHLRSSGSPE